jgi:hypothetical protein
MKPASAFLLVALACVSFAFSAVAPQQPPLAQGWRQTQMTDPYRGAYVRFSLAGKFLKTLPDDASNRPSLVVDCSANNRSHKSKFIRGTLVVGDPLKIDWVEPEQIETVSYLPEVSVRYRLDDGKEDQEDWTPSADKKSASFSKGSLEKMLRAHIIEITADDKRGTKIVMQFDMPNPKLIEQGCDVDEHKK